MTSLVKQYQEYLDRAAGITGLSSQGTPLRPALNVAIIGGGMSGLYSAILLQHYIPGVKVRIFEAEDRVGGCVHTYKFSPEPNQYFEAGAMRIPHVENHQPVFTLIDYLNKQFPTDLIELMDFKYLSPEGNRVFVNGTKQKDGHVMSVMYASKNCSELGFPKGVVADGDNASTLFNEALAPIVRALEEDFEAGLVKYAYMSLREYLSKELGWNREKINYVEVMCSQTDDFNIGLLEMFFFDGIFDFQFSYKTIKGGMSKLPEMCAESIKQNGGTILLNAKVESIVQHDNGIEVGYVSPGSHKLLDENFDAVIITLPPPLLRLMPKRPNFGLEVETALRVSHSSSMSKLGLRFKSRFWERPDLVPPPSYGGQSTTDLPSRWIIYPDYGVGDSGKGVLHTYRWSGDAVQWCLLSKTEQVKLALRDLQLLYPEINIADEYAGGSPGDDNFLKEAYSTDWWGDIYYKPGQFLSSYPSMAKPQGNIYFAGAHLSSSLGWIQSALESSKRTVQQLALKYGITGVEFV